MYIRKGAKRSNKLFRIVLTVFVIVAAALLAGCGTSKPTDNLESVQPAETQNFVWTATSNCIGCHAAEVKSTTDTTMLIAAHSKVGVKCMSCHTDEAALKAAHDGATVASPVATRLKATAVDETTCLSPACHNTTLAELAKKTAGSTVLKDTKGTAVNPHMVPTMTKSHVDAKMTCTNCHSMHKAQDAMNFCVTCHHARVFQCGTCHKV